MTKITFFKKDNFYLGFEVKGHTGKEEFGKDLLCAQISTVAQLAIVGVEGEKIKDFHQIADGYLKLTIGENEAKNEKVQFLFKTCLQSFRSIISGEEKYAKLEVKNV